MNRTAFLVDGFNLYHSLDRASADLGGVSTKWLDLRGLCGTFLYQIGGQSEISDVFYFSALASHMETRSPGGTDRHLKYIGALRASGVTVELGQFKEKWIKCAGCGQTSTRHEEKETDVAIAVRLMELLWNDKCDTAVLVTADSDLGPALREANRTFPGKQFFCCFPYARGSFDLRALAKKCFRIRKERYVQHQLPDPVALPSGLKIVKPMEW